MKDVLKKKIILSALGVFFCLNLLAWFAVFQTSQGRLLKVVFFDVGQGDSIFIETAKRTQILIDGGPGSRAVEKLGQELPFFDREIDFVILSHPDKDHLGGLVETLKGYKAGMVGWTGIKNQEPLFQEFEKEAEKDRARKIVLKRGDKITVGKDLQFQVLAPFEDFEGKEAKDANTSSLVLRLVYGENEFLFTGDAPKTVERKLLESGDVLESDVLKIGHHGSANSTTEEFLDKVEPEIAIIQVGKNSYGHPDKEVLERLEKYDIKVMRTDQDGDITITSDGTGYRITN